MPKWVYRVRTPVSSSFHNLIRFGRTLCNTKELRIWYSNTLKVTMFPCVMLTTAQDKVLQATDLKSKRRL